MGVYFRQTWMGEGLGQSRKQRMSGAYHAFVPSSLVELPLRMDSDVAADVSRAELALAQFAMQSRVLHSSEGIARLLLRAEAVSSSHIEGLTIGTRRLLRAEANRQGARNFRFDEPAAEIVGNIYAMETALSHALEAPRVTVDVLCDVHRELCKGTRIEQYGGCVRTRQNWVGGNSYNPLQADYVPPGPEHVMPLLEDLADFCNTDAVSPVVQAALVHAQFESIHPFLDGNGRTGRALIHLVLRRRGLTPEFVPPISLVMATRSASYVNGLTGFRFDDAAGEEEGIQAVNEWISFFAGACAQACAEAAAFEESAVRLSGEWRERMAPVRRNSALDLLCDQMVGMPLFSIETAAAMMGRSFQAVAQAVESCVKAGVVKEVSGAKRNRIFEVPEAIDEFNIFERRLASPVGDTREVAPVRPVPQRLR